MERLAAVVVIVAGNFQLIATAPDAPPADPKLLLFHATRTLALPLTLAIVLFPPRSPRRLLF